MMNDENDEESPFTLKSQNSEHPNLQRELVSAAGRKPRADC